MEKTQLISLSSQKRLLLIAAELHNKQNVTMRELAEKLNVSKKTISRDLDLLEGI